MKKRALGTLWERYGYICMIQYSDGSYSDIYYFKGIEDGRLKVNLFSDEHFVMTKLFDEDAILGVDYIDLPSDCKLLLAKVRSKMSRNVKIRLFGYEVCNDIINLAMGMLNILTRDANSRYNKIAKGIKNDLKYIKVNNDGNASFEVISSSDSLKIYHSGSCDSGYFYTVDSRIREDGVTDGGTKCSIINCSSASPYHYGVIVCNIIKRIGGHLDELVVPNQGINSNLLMIARDGKSFIFNSESYKDGLLDYFESYGEYYTFGTQDDVDFEVNTDRLLNSTKNNPYIYRLCEQRGISLCGESYGVHYRFPNMKTTIYRHSETRSKLVVLKIVKQKGLDDSTMYYYINNILEPRYSRNDYPSVLYASMNYKDIKSAFNSLYRYKNILPMQACIGEPLVIGGNNFHIQYVEDGTDRFRVVYSWADSSISYESIFSKYGNEYDCHYKRPSGFTDVEVDRVRENIKSRFPCLNKVINGRFTVYKYINGKVAYDRKHEYMNASLFNQVLRSIRWIKGFKGIIVLNDGNKILKEYYYDDSSTGITKYKLIVRKDVR